MPCVEPVAFEDRPKAVSLDEADLDVGVVKATDHLVSFVHALNLERGCDTFGGPPPGLYRGDPRDGEPSPMNRIVAIGALVALLVIGSPSPAHAGVRVEHSADAVFVLPERNGTHPAFFVSALRMAWVPEDGSLESPGSVPVTFSISRGECRDPSSLDSCVVTDRGWVGGRFREGDVFEFDEDLSSAHLKVTRKGITHEVRWTATSEHVPVVRAGGCSVPTVATDAGARRGASAKGRVFGHKVETIHAGGSDAELSTIAYTC